MIPPVIVVLVVSFAVTVYGLVPVNATKDDPEITPVVALIVKPVGNEVAVN
jgi:hypothetical protein